MPKDDWDKFKCMGIDQAIQTIFAISEFNKCGLRDNKPMLIPGEYLRPPGKREKYTTNYPENVNVQNSSPFVLGKNSKRLYGYNLMSEIIPNITQMSFNGYIIAGGAAIKTIVGFNDYHSDVDFYPLYTTRALDNDYDNIIISYNKWLTDCSLTVQNKIKHIARSEHTTTIKFIVNTKDSFLYYKTCSIYQMIHRAYRNPEEVIVGFDQPCCKAFFDGNETYVTLDCALCIHYNINPIDWRAESPTHILRALKYQNRDFRWVIPKVINVIDNIDNKFYRFAAGIICVTKDGKTELLKQYYNAVKVENQNEFPQPSHQSNYQSDYEPKLLDYIIQGGYDLATVENPITYNDPIDNDNLRAAATNNPTYYIAYSTNFEDFIKNKFIKPDVIMQIERQEYRHYYLHRSKMIEIANEINKIQDRIQLPSNYNGKFKHLGMDAPRPHRFKIDETQRYLELCNKAKVLHDEYIEVVVKNT